MKTWVRKSLKVGVLSAGFLLIGGAAAASAATTTDNFGILGGNQVQAPIQVPISVTGNAIGLLGPASAASHGSGAMVSPSATGAGSSSDNTGVGSGNQVTPVIQVPIDVCGNSIGALGSADASCGARSGSGRGNGGYANGCGRGRARRGNR